MKGRASFVAEIDGAELACRIVEAFTGCKRPEGYKAEQALNSMPTETSAAAMAAAEAAARYLTECLKLGARPS